MSFEEKSSNARIEHRSHRTISFMATLFAFSFALTATPASAGEPQWIWGTATSATKAPPEQCLFRKTFQAPAGASGELGITCDNRYVVRVNRRLVAANNVWGVMDRYNISPLLVEGENTIDVRAANDDDGPAGFVARLTIQPKEGAAIDYSTDKSWQAFLIPKQSTWDPTKKVEPVYVAAFELGPFGKQAPWGNGVRQGELKEVAKGASPSSFDTPFELKDEDRVVLLGGTMIEREQRSGIWEEAITKAFPGKKFVMRNLGWSGDAVTGISRARFGSPADGFQHLAEHVLAEKPTWIIMSYGAVESFEGPAGLPGFTSNLNTLLDSLEQTGARIAIVSPIRCETLAPPLPDMSKHNIELLSYVDVLRETAKERGHRFVDLYAMTARNAGEKPLTYNGIHLDDYGYQQTAPLLLKGLDAKVDPSMLSASESLQPSTLRDLIVKKNELYFHRWRPQNETYLFLFRKGEQGNNAVEIPKFDPLVAELEGKIREESLKQ